MKNVSRNFFLLFVMSTCALPALSTALLWDEDEVVGELISWENSAQYGDRKTCLGKRVTLFINDQSTSLNGTSGNDVIWVEMSRVNATIDAKGGDDLICVFGNNVTVKGGTGSDVIYLNGNRAANYVVWGGSGNDYIYGYQSRGNSQNATVLNSLEIHGDSGDDTLYCPPYTVGAQGCDAYGEVGNDKIYGGSGFDFLIGGDGNDDIWGYGGGDIISGGIGSDRIWGGSGDDEIWGDEGSDRLYGEDGDDLFPEMADIDADLINGGNGHYDTLSNPSNKDTFTNIERFNQ